LLTLNSYYYSDVDVLDQQSVLLNVIQRYLNMSKSLLNVSRFSETNEVVFGKTRGLPHGRRT